MPRSKRRSGSFTATILLGITALVLFGVGEAVVMTRTDGGRIAAARWLHLGDDARLRAAIGRQVRSGLESAGVTRDSVHETVSGGREPRVHWRVGLRPRASTLQANYAVTRALESQGAVVLSGREEPGAHGEL